MPQLKAAEVITHPEFKNAFWQLQPAAAGKVSVAKDRDGALDLYYEVHGTGPTRVVWIMGLGAFLNAWQRQTKYFGHDRGSEYSCLVYDNRGMGRSDKPLRRYTTSGMAQDLLEILKHIGWTSTRELHVVGISMGGMIAQELAYVAPERIASLTLMATAAKLTNTVGFLENFRNRINMFIPKDIDVQLDEIKHRMFSDAWLEVSDAAGGFPTNGDCYAAQELTKRRDNNGFTRKGFICQAAAVGFHAKSMEQIKQIGDRVGRERIQIVHGTLDTLITVPHAEFLYGYFGGEGSGVGKTILDGKGHGLPVEAEDETQRLVSELIHKTKSLG